MYGNSRHNTVMTRSEFSAYHVFVFFFFQAEDGIRDLTVTGVQTCALPISRSPSDRNTSAPVRGRGAATVSDVFRSDGERADAERDDVAAHGRRDRKSVV